MNFANTNQPPKYASVVERNFVPYLSVGNPGVRYLRHPNGVIVITLAPLFAGKEIESFSWETSQKKSSVDRSKLQIIGKGKRGGLQLFPDSKLCIIRCKDGSELVIRAGIRATLVEVNYERLSNAPNLALTEAISGLGYLAIVVPSGSDGRNLLHVPKELTLEVESIGNL